MVVSKRNQRVNVKHITPPTPSTTGTDTDSDADIYNKSHIGLHKIDIYIHHNQNEKSIHKLPIEHTHHHTNNPSTPNTPSPSESSSYISHKHTTTIYRILRYTISLCILSLLFILPLLRINGTMNHTIMCMEYRYMNNMHQDDTRPPHSGSVTPPDDDMNVPRMIHNHTLKQNGNKVSACIYILTHSSRISLLKRLLFQLHQHFNVYYHYDVYVFQDDYTVDDHIQLQTFITKQLFHNDHHAYMNDTNGSKPMQVQAQRYPIYIQSVKLSRPTHITDSDLRQHTGCIGYEKICNDTKTHITNAESKQANTKKYDINHGESSADVSASTEGVCIDDWSLSYRDMCYFHAITASTLPQLQGYTYYLRLDDDSEITGDIPYDIFLYAQLHNVKYGFVALDWEEDTCDVGLIELVDKYRHDRMMKQQLALYTHHNHRAMHMTTDAGLDGEPQSIPNAATPSSSRSDSKHHVLPPHMIVYNNFELSRIDFWRERETYEWLIHYVDQSKGIYTHRWGDAPVKSMAAFTLLDGEKEIHYLGDVIPYKHKTRVTVAGYTSPITRWIYRIIRWTVC